MNAPAQTAPSPRSIRDRIGDFADWINPMLVKELRQGLRTWVFVALFVFLQVVGSLILLGGEYNESFARKGSAGFFWSLIILILVIFQPLRAITALSQERKNKTMDFLEVSNLTALKIVWGKWLSIFAQSALIMVSVLPYFILRYFQGGFNLFNEAGALLGVLMVSGLLTAIVTATSTEESKVKLAFLYLPMLLFGGGLFMSLAIAMTMGGSSSFTRMFPASWVTMSWWSMAGHGVFLFMMWAYLIWVFLSWAAQIIAPRSENLSTPVRLIALGVWLVIAALSWIIDKHFACGALIMITGLMVIQSFSERVSILPPVLLPFVKKGLFGQIAGRVLYPGWTSGILYALIMTELLFVWLVVRFPQWDKIENSAIILWLMWGVFVLPAVLLYGFSHWSKERKPTTYFSILLVVHFVGSLVSHVSLASSRRSNTAEEATDWLAYVNPSSALVYYSRYHNERGVDGVMMSSFIMVLIYTLWLIWRVIKHNKDLFRAENHLIGVMPHSAEKNL